MQLIKWEKSFEIFWLHGPMKPGIKKIFRFGPFFQNNEQCMCVCVCVGGGGGGLKVASILCLIL